MASGVWTYWVSSSSSTTTDSTWSNWCDSTSTATSTNEIWPTWCGDTGTSTAVYKGTNTIWATWCEEEDAYTYVYSTPKESEEDKRKRLIAHAKTKAKAIIAKRKEKKAYAKAIELLEDVMGKEAREVYQKTGRILVKGKKYDWLIENRQYGNSVKVSKVDKNKIIDLCVYCKGAAKFPQPDHALAMALNAKYAEDYLDEKANFVSEKSLEELPEAAVM
jgi:hypothetical protein